jgi:hypothetical protein
VDERIKKIRELLDDVDGTLNKGPDQEFAHNFDALELPSIVSSVVCHLQPLLAPIEAAIYWRMFDRSILQTGQQYCRVSTRGLMNGVVKSTKSDDLSIQSTRGALKALEDKGAAWGKSTMWGRDVMAVAILSSTGDAKLSINFSGAA